jgi:hypothetical protein
VSACPHLVKNRHHSEKQKLKKPPVELYVEISFSIKLLFYPIFRKRYWIELKLPVITLFNP